jgi:hypothetical protein
MVDGLMMIGLLETAADIAAVISVFVEELAGTVTSKGP